MAAWLSLSGKSGETIVHARQVVESAWASSVASLLSKIDAKHEEETLTRAQISKRESIDSHVVPATAPVSLCENFRCHHSAKEKRKFRLLLVL